MRFDGAVDETPDGLLALAEVAGADTAAVLGILAECFQQADDEAELLFGDCEDLPDEQAEIVFSAGFARLPLEHKLARLGRLHRA